MEQQCLVLWSLLRHLLSVSVREWFVCSYEVHLSAALLWQSCDARGGVACMLACVHSFLAQGMATGSTLVCPTLAKSGHGLTETMHSRRHSNFAHVSAPVHVHMSWQCSCGVLTRQS
jgi:hypothetical protein